MNTPKKSTVLLSTVASGLLLAACAPHQRTPNASDNLPLVIADVAPLSSADLYAHRYPSSLVQVTTGGKHRFVSCQPSCPGATPKTPVSSVNAAVARRARQELLAERSRVRTTNHADGDGTKPDEAGER